MQGRETTGRAANNRRPRPRALMLVFAPIAALAVLTACGSTETPLSETPSSSATPPPASPVQPASSPPMPASTTPDATVDTVAEATVDADYEADTVVPPAGSDGQVAMPNEAVPPPAAPAPGAPPAPLPDQPAAFPYGPIPIRAGSVCDPIGCVGPDGNGYLNPNTPPSVDGIPWGTTCDYVTCTDYYGLVREDPRAPGGYLDPVANNTTCHGFICVPNEAPADPDPSTPTPAS